jgi:hypothetical protein
MQMKMVKKNIIFRDVTFAAYIDILFDSEDEFSMFLLNFSILSRDAEMC